LIVHDFGNSENSMSSILASRSHKRKLTFQKFVGAGLVPARIVRMDDQADSQLFKLEFHIKLIRACARRAGTSPAAT
jgi:hypothetical protein